MLKAFAVATAILAIALSACGGATSPPTTTPTAAVPPRATPVATTAPTPVPTRQATPTTAAPQAKQGGILRTSVAGDPPGKDPLKFNTVRVQWMASASYSSLIRYNEQDYSKVVGDLATGWDGNADGTVITFRLRSGVKFHDGTPFTAEDAKISLERRISPPPGAGNPVPAFRGVAKVEAPDATTLRLTLKEPDSILLPSFAERAYYVVFPKHILDQKPDMNQDVIGTGPYKFQRFDTGSVWKVVKNPDYFLPGRPYLDGVDYVVIPDRATRLGALKTGQTHMTETASGGVTETEAQDLRKNASDRIAVVPFDSLYGNKLKVNPSNGPFKDVRVRRAVWLAIDREASIQALSQGAGRLGLYINNPGPWSRPQAAIEAMPGMRPAKTQDLAEAKRLLTEAGYANGFDVDMLIRSDIAAFKLEGEFIQAQLRSVGLNVKFNLQETARWQELINNGSFQFEPSVIVLRLDDPADALSFITVPNAHVNDPPTTELYSQMRKTMDPVAKKALGLKLEDILIEKAYDVPLHWQVNNIAVSKKVHGIFDGPTPPVSLLSHYGFIDTWID